MNNWYSYIDKENPIILSSRIRIARNLVNVPFPGKLNKEQAREVVKKVEEGIYSSSFTKDKYSTIYLWEKNDLETLAYFEKNLISKNLIKNKENSAFIIDKDETLSLMVNEEDHIRLQCITGGFNIDEAYEAAFKLDDLLEENLEYAFDENLGYLTACPTNIGTGMRASVMLHLPALTMNKEIITILNALTQVGMTIRGLYGEGSQGEGNFYQISNQVTLGLSEDDVINNLKAIVKQVVNQENMAREKIMKNYNYELSDKIYRSRGILESAVILGSKECLNLISNVRLGVELGLISDIEIDKLSTLLVRIQPANLQSYYGTKMDERVRDINRAKLVREILKK